MPKCLEVLKWWELICIEDIFGITALAVSVDMIQMRNNLGRNQVDPSSKNL